MENNKIEEFNVWFNALNPIFQKCLYAEHFVKTGFEIVNFSYNEGGKTPEISLKPLLFYKESITAIALSCVIISQEDLYLLSEFKNLTKLYIIDMLFKDNNLRFISMLDNLKILILDNLKISSINFLKNCHSLQLIEIVTCSELKDFSALHDLAGCLECIRISDSEIPNIDFILEFKDYPFHFEFRNTLMTDFSYPDEALSYYWSMKKKVPNFKFYPQPPDPSK